MSGEAQGCYAAGASSAAGEENEYEYGILKQGQSVSRPHTEMMYNQVDELGSDEWIENDMIGPDGEVLKRTIPRTDAEIRLMRAESVTAGVDNMGADGILRSVAPNAPAILKSDPKVGKWWPSSKAPRRAASAPVKSDSEVGKLWPASAAQFRAAGSTPRAAGRAVHDDDWRGETEGALHHVDGVPDSGAGRTLLTSVDGAAWASDSREVIYFELADGSIVQGIGGACLDVAIRDEHGDWRKKRTGKAYVVSSASGTLLSIPASQQEGLGVDYPPGGGAYVYDSTGRRYPMTLRGDVHRLAMKILPAGNTVPEGVKVDVCDARGVESVVRDPVTETMPPATRACPDVPVKASPDPIVEAGDTDDWEALNALVLYIVPLVLQAGACTGVIRVMTCRNGEVCVLSGRDRGSTAAEIEPALGSTAKRLRVMRGFIWRPPSAPTAVSTAGAANESKRATQVSTTGTEAASAAKASAAGSTEQMEPVRGTFRPSGPAKPDSKVGEWWPISKAPLRAASAPVKPYSEVGTIVKSDSKVGKWVSDSKVGTVTWWPISKAPLREASAPVKPDSKVGEWWPISKAPFRAASAAAAAAAGSNEQMEPVRLIFRPSEPVKSDSEVGTVVDESTAPLRAASAPVKPHTEVGTVLLPFRAASAAGGSAERPGPHGLTEAKGPKRVPAAEAGLQSAAKYKCSQCGFDNLFVP